MSPIDDEMGLRNLMARYVDAVNRYDGNAWIATWADNSCWHLMGTAVEGKDAIRALWEQMMSNFEIAVLFPNSCLFDIDGHTATGHWYLHEYSRDLQGNASAILSRYLDSYAKVEDEWLFTSRQYDIIYNGPADLSGPFCRPPEPIRG